MPALTRRRLITWLLAPLLAFAALASWAVSSPVGSSPDDDFHLASIWCGVGERDGLCEPGNADDEQSVPRELGTAACYAHDPQASAECQGDTYGDEPLKLESTARGNFAGLYPPLYYAVTGIFASTGVEATVLAVRLFNSALFLGLLVALLALLPRERRVPALAAVVVTLVPVSIFLLSSINPSAWAVISAATVLPALLGYFETTGRRRIGLAAVAVVGAVMGAGARADSAVFVGIACVLAVFLAARRGRGFVLASLLPIALTVVAVLLYFSSTQSQAVNTGLEGVAPPSVRSAFVFLALNILEVPSLWLGAFGGLNWGLGWLDTPVPAFVWIGGSVIFAVALACGLRDLRGRPFVAAVALFAAAWLFPTYLLIRTQAIVGSYVQPRYILPLLVMLAFVAVLQTRIAPSRRLLVVLIGVLAAANSIALHTNIRRYTTGLDSLRILLDSDVEWWTAPISPMTVWILGTIAFTLALVALLFPLWHSAPRRGDAPDTQASGPVAYSEANRAGTLVNPAPEASSRNRA